MWDSGVAAAAVMAIAAAIALAKHRLRKQRRNPVTALVIDPTFGALLRIARALRLRRAKDVIAYDGTQRQASETRRAEAFAATAIAATVGAKSVAAAAAKIGVTAQVR